MQAPVSRPRRLLVGLALSAACCVSVPAMAATPVLVAGFQPETRESAGLAALLTSVLEQQLALEQQLRLVQVDEVPPMYGTSVRLYLETCPAGEAVGCAYVVSQHAQADYALTGLVGLGQDAVRVQLSLVDVAQARESVGLDLEIPPGQDHLLMEQVAVILGRLIRGELGQLEDIRREGAYDEVSTRELVQEELDGLYAETGAEVQLGSLSTGLRVGLPDFTPQDLEELRQEEGLTEWERLGLTERSYSEYRNSGLDLRSWRALSAGRQLQLLVRPRVGTLFGPVSGEYLGAFLQDPALGVEEGILETYAWQAIRGGLGGSYGVDLGLGLTPTIEVEAGIARAHGRYTTTIRQEVVATTLRPDNPIQDGTASTVISGGLRLAPFPTRRFRPLVAAGVVMWRGTRVTQHVDLSSLTVELPDFAAPTLIGGRGLAGVELELGPHWDLVAQLPLCILVGDFSEVHDEGVDVLSSKEPPPGPMPVSVGLELSLQLRLGGLDPDRRGPRHGQIEDEDELDLLD